jgi:hypothetical protein
MTWVLLAGIAWAALALPVAFLFGRGLCAADRRREMAGRPPVPDFIPADVFASLSASPER